MFKLQTAAYFPPACNYAAVGTLRPTAAKPATRPRSSLLTSVTLTLMSLLDVSYN